MDGYLCLDLALLDIDLVAAQDDGNIVAHADQVSVPGGHVLVRDARRHVKHDNRTVSLDVVPVPQPAKLFLSGAMD